jgi:hypothetical protein
MSTGDSVMVVVLLCLAVPSTDELRGIDHLHEGLGIGVSPSKFIAGVLNAGREFLDDTSQERL